MLRRTILVALGANLPAPGGTPPARTCEHAIHHLSRLPGLHLVAAAPLYRSTPDPPSAQPDYVNGAVLLRGEAEPHALLDALHAIEAGFGRHRTTPNAARPLDLDLLAIDDLVIDTPTLQLPHPRLHLRRFVLLPLADIAPLWSHPRLALTAPAMLARLPDDGTARLASSPPPH